MTGKQFERAEVPSIEYFRSLYEKGDLDQLLKENEIYAKRANWRLSDLEKQGYDTTAAYKMAQKKINDFEFIKKGKRFSRSKKLSLDDVYDQIKAETNFLRWQTSTPAGERKRRERVFEGLTSQRIDAETGEILDPVLSPPEGMDMDDFKNKFLEFLDDDAWSEIKKHIYHKEILNEAGEAISAGADIEELQAAMDDYINKETDKDLLTIWDEWTKAT